MAKGDSRKARNVQGRVAAQAVDAQLIIRKEIEEAAARIADELGGLRAGPELGFLGDIVDAVGDAVDAVEEVVVAVTRAVIGWLDGDGIGPWVTDTSANPYIIFVGEGTPLERGIEGAEKPNEASAEQLLAIRQSLLDARDSVRRRVREIAKAAGADT